MPKKLKTMPVKVKEEDMPPHRIVTPHPKDVKTDPELAKKAATEPKEASLQSDKDKKEPKRVGAKGPLKVGVNFDHSG